MPLFKVEKIYYVVADNEDDAGETRVDDLMACDTSVAPITRVKDILYGWRTAYPFGGDGDMTCEEIVNRRK